VDPLARGSVKNQILDAGWWILDEKKTILFPIQYPVSSIQHHNRLSLAVNSPNETAPTTLPKE
jgi:hypothetical protein